VRARHRARSPPSAIGEIVASVQLGGVAEARRRRPCRRRVGGEFAGASVAGTLRRLTSRDQSTWLFRDEADRELFLERETLLDRRRAWAPAPARSPLPRRSAAAS
jgi:hypothetical protein